MLQFLLPLLPKITMNIGRRSARAQTPAAIALEFAYFKGEVLARVSAVEKIQGEQAQAQSAFAEGTARKLDNIGSQLTEILVKIAALPHRK